MQRHALTGADAEGAEKTDNYLFFLDESDELHRLATRGTPKVDVEGALQKLAPVIAPHVLKAATEKPAVEVALELLAYCRYLAACSSPDANRRARFGFGEIGEHLRARRLP